MRRFPLLRDQRGASALEFALMAPVFFSVLIGAAQMGILFFANTGLQHAVGEGARVAMIFPRPSEATIRQAVKDAKYGLDANYLVGEPVVTIDETGDPDFAEISWSYNVPLNFIFYQTPAITLEHKRKVFLQAAAAAGGTGTGGSTSTSSTSTSSTSTSSTSSGNNGSSGNGKGSDEAKGNDKK